MNYRGDSRHCNLLRPNWETNPDVEAAFVVFWKIITKRLGQGSVAMTLDLYAHASPGLQKAAAEGFDKVLDKQRDVGEMNRTSPAQT